MQINIEGILTNCVIGCHDHERMDKQQVVVDMKLQLYQQDYTQTDDLTATVDYDEIISCVKQTVEVSDYYLLESLSQKLVEVILTRYELITEVKVTVTKPAIAGDNASCIKVVLKKKRKFKIALALGSNDNLASNQIITAIELLSQYVADISIGGFYSTSPYGFTPQNNFVNTAITGTVTLLPQKLLSKIKIIEKLMGKKEITNNGPRVIDIDIIFFANQIHQHNFLVIPHKDMHQRDFVLRPLCDIAPHWLHPRFNKTVSELLSSVTDKFVLAKLPNS